MYKPPYDITNKILKLSISITEKIGLINAFSSLKRMPILRKNNKIKSINLLVYVKKMNVTVLVVEFYIQIKS